MSFFQGFSLDTLLGVISCLLGIAALIIGTKAFHDCKIVKSSLNDRKEFKDSSSDYSQRAAGDIVNNNCDVEALTKLTAATFETSLKAAYSVFEQQAKANLQQILEKAKQLIEEQKSNLAGLTKIDWINIYFESAKNTSDAYMQSVWARVLAKELEIPGSFSFKTLDVLKNMSAEIFQMFEKMLSLQVEGEILQKEIEEKHHLDWTQFLQLSEYGLINLEASQKTITVSPSSTHLQLIGKNYVLTYKNETDVEKQIQYQCYLLSFAAKELMSIVSVSDEEEYAIGFANYVRNYAARISGVTIGLHRVYEITEKPDQPGVYNVNYNTENLLL